MFDIDWFGDDTPMGWAVTVAYFVAALLTFDAARRVGAPREVERFVRGIAIALAVLGFNKQLDLQTTFFTVGGHLARVVGLGEQRELLHGAWLLAALAALTALAWAGVTRLRAHARRVAPMAIGCAAFVTFVVLRIAVFGRLGAALGIDWLDSELPGLLELAAIALLAVGAQRVASPRPAIAR